jgi:type I restriction enzyme R subunit
LLSFPNGALVHFAVSNREVHMTTRLVGADTEFLPFNQGDHGAEGNPVNPTSGHSTAYLWEQVWERQSWLEILGRSLVAQKDEKKQIEKITSCSVLRVCTRPFANRRRQRKRNRNRRRR